jgi:hypothetical protein
MMTSHDSLYTPPVGRGFSADDLAAAQLKQLEESLAVQLPALVDLGTAVYAEEIRQQERMKQLELQMRESLSPDNLKRARDIFRQRAEAKIKAEAAVIKLAQESLKAEAASIVAAETRSRLGDE